MVAAGQHGMHVGVMLFQGFSISRKSKRRRHTPWDYHPLNRANNVNRINGDLDGDGEGYETHELRVPGVTRVQEAYVRKVIDTLGDLDNVIYEIGNECHGRSTRWQHHMIRFIHEYERGKPKQHPVWMTFQWDGMAGPGTSEGLFRSPAEAVSPDRRWGKQTRAYELDPPPGNGEKVVIVDTDHINPPDVDRADWVWKCFTRGLNPIFMDNPVVKGFARHPVLNDTSPEGPSARTRAAMGQTRTFANRMDLAAMTPTVDPADCSTRYCLRNPGAEYLVYQPEGGAFTVALRAGLYHFEWFQPRKGRTVSSGRIEAKDNPSRFAPPFAGGAVLYLRAAASGN